tara:strand:- start:1691 stop:2452 length:762 start_codon:yes stop_codon:yes gene_type:complete
MNYKIILLFCFIFLVSCELSSKKKLNYTNKFINYSNKGFTLVYDEKLFKNKNINRKLNDRSLLVFSKVLKHETPIKITNLINGKYLIARVGKSSKYPIFYNSVISKRIAEELDIDKNEPYIELKTLDQSNSFIIGKAKTFDEEKEVANKAPVDGIKIENIGNELIVENTDDTIEPKDSFKYIIKIADLYFLDSAKILKNRLLNEYSIKNIKIKKMSKNSYRIYKGPFIDLESIKNDYKDIIRLDFENIEIIKL